ncbi:hypothetical protein WA026_023112 [Henosepilachna vigintioctopunctata]|uniref:Uncharacterized protein n=1 Tax=Henosepilachna vigintioctopunctata TaxID=420089 RepID=A0AAW1U7T9_9CUCU
MPFCVARKIPVTRPPTERKGTLSHVPQEMGLLSHVYTTDTTNIHYPSWCIEILDWSIDRARLSCAEARGVPPFRASGVGARTQFISDVRLTKCSGLDMTST